MARVPPLLERKLPRTKAPRWFPTPPSCPPMEQTRLVLPWLQERLLLEALERPLLLLPMAARLRQVPMVAHLRQVPMAAHLRQVPMVHLARARTVRLRQVPMARLHLVPMGTLLPERMAVLLQGPPTGQRQRGMQELTLMALLLPWERPLMGHVEDGVPLRRSCRS